MNLTVIALCVSLIIGALGGYGVADLYFERKIAGMEAAQAQALANAEQLYQQHMTAAQAEGDKLSNRLAQTEAALNQSTLEVSNALAKTTRGSTCLNSATVRLLNHVPNPAPSAGLPIAAGGPAPENAGTATDTDIAAWIAGAQSQYGACRARLDALIQFNEDQNHG
jgi:hypothetical protein